MAKKKIKKVAKAKKIVRKKKVVRGKKVVKTKKVIKVKGPKVIGKIDHYFGHINVAALKLKEPLKIGDTIQIKGATTDFTQTVDSMQTNHKDIQAAKKGEEIGFKVRDKVRAGDTVYVAPPQAKVESPSFPALSNFKPQQNKPASIAPAKPEDQKPKSYNEVKFLGF